MQSAVVNECFVEQGAGSKMVRRYASVCLCVCGCARIYILIRNCLCVYFMHQLVIHFIDVCSIVSLVWCRFTPAVELWIFGVYTLIESCACFRSPLLLFFYIFLCYYSSLLLFPFSYLFLHLSFPIFHVLVWSFLSYLCLYSCRISVCVCVCFCVVSFFYVSFSHLSGIVIVCVCVCVCLYVISLFSFYL